MVPRGTQEETQVDGAEVEMRAAIVVASAIVTAVIWIVTIKALKEDSKERKEKENVRG